MKTIKVKDYYGNYLSIPVDDQFYDEWKDMEREENRLYKRKRYHCFPVDPDTFDDLAVSIGADQILLVIPPAWRGCKNYLRCGERFFASLARTDFIASCSRKSSSCKA